MIKHDYFLLRLAIKRKFKNEKEFVKNMQNTSTYMSVGSFNNKINNKSDFTSSEIHEMCKLLGIPLNEVHTYFFEENYELNS